MTPSSANLPPSTPAPPSHKSGPARIILISIVLAVIGVLLIPGYYVGERIHGKMAWQKYASEARQRGVKLELAEFRPPKIPDAENYASIPIFAAAFQAADRNEEASNPFKLEKSPDGELPKGDDAVQQHLIDLAAWQKYFVKVKRLPVAAADPAAGVLQAIETFAGPLAQLRAAGARPHCSFPVRWERGPAAALPHYGLMLDANRLYSLRLAAHLAQGDSAAAYEDFRASLRLITATRAEPSLIPGLVRMSLLGVLGQAVWGGLATHRWEEPELRKIEADLAAVDFLPDAVFCLSSSRGGANGIADLALEDTRVLPQLNDTKSRQAGKRWPWLFYPTGWVYEGKVRLNQLFDELLARIAPEEHRWHNERPISLLPETLKENGEGFRNMIYVLSAPFYLEMERKYLQVATIADQMRLACALERYRLAHGSLPETLAELSPEFLAAVPHEIVNGEPYHYRRTEDGSFVLYSVGVDLHDDGGVINPKLNFRKQPDWVWRYPVPAAPEKRRGE